MSAVLAMPPLHKAEEFEIVCGLLEATWEFKTEHLLLKAFEQSCKPGLCLDSLVLAEHLEDAFPT